jgi:hypothetical protein
MKSASQRFLVGVLSVVFRGVSACAKKVTLDAPKAKRINQELAVAQRAANNTLAYEHEVTLLIDRDQLAHSVEATRAAGSYPATHVLALDRKLVEPQGAR